MIWLQQFREGFEKLYPKPSNSIESWVLLRMAALLIVLGALFLIIAVCVLNKRFDAFDIDEYLEQASRVIIALDQDKKSLEGMLNDYAHWDDSLNFIKGTNKNYIALNLSGSSLNSLNINSVAFTKLDASPVATLIVTSDGTLEDMSPEMLAVATPFFKRAAQSTTKGKLSSIIWLNGEPILATAEPVTDSAHKIPTNGYMYMFRNLGGKYLQDIQQATAVSFTFQPAAVAPTRELIVKQSGKWFPNHWTVNESLANLPIQIRVSGSTNLLKERRVTYWTFEAFAVALMLLSLVGIYLILNRRILGRLKAFSQLADRHRTEQDANIRWPVQGEDELDNLASSLNELIIDINVKHVDLNFLAEHDLLTGVGNRRLLQSRLEALQNRTSRQPSLTSSLLLLDLDNFKLINDSLGHSVGDKVLKVIATRILAQTRNYDAVTRPGKVENVTQLGGYKTVTRLGGDEFAILLEDSEPALALPYAERLLSAVEQPIEHEGKYLTVRGSVGIAPIEASMKHEDIIRNADLAMYEAKRRGKSQVVTFNNGLLSKASRHLQLEQALKQALDNRLLEVWFQPIVEHCGDVVGMEALSRWSLDKYYVSPDEFIPIAESAGLITELGRFVLDYVCAALDELRVDHPNLQCSVNLSVRQFQDKSLVSGINACLRKYNLPAEAIKLELTESIIAEYETEILPTMQELVNMGYKFYLDDFGTGYSSLDRLRKLPFDVLKIDRSFVTQLGKGDDIIARNIINIGFQLGMGLIAEGVETEEELSRLVALGCKQFQGYYFAKPMPLADLRDWLASRKKRTQ